MSKVQQWTQMPPELVAKIDAFAAQYGYGRSAAIRVLVMLGLTEFEALQERAKRQASGMYSDIPQPTR